MNKFLGSSFDDQERWDIIEHFFLGRNEWVNQKLNRFVDMTKQTQFKSNQIKIKDFGVHTVEFYEKWEELECGELFESLSIPLPDFLGSEVIIDNNTYTLEYFWKDLNVGIVSSAKRFSDENIGSSFMKLLNFDEINYASLKNLFGSE